MRSESRRSDQQASQIPITESQNATPGSHPATAESHDATPGSHGALREGVPTRQNDAPYSEILQNEIHERSHTTTRNDRRNSRGDRGGLTATERYACFAKASAPVQRTSSVRFDRGTVQADMERRRGLGQGIGAIVTTWRVEPPRAATPDPATAPVKHHAARRARRPRRWRSPRPTPAHLRSSTSPSTSRRARPRSARWPTCRQRRAATPAGGVA
jgi:hypothetical protein